MYVKIHEDKRTKRVVVAICDEDLIGKEFSEGNANLKVTERFYKGEKKSEEEVKKVLENADNLNLVGKKTVALAIKQKFVSKEFLIKIKGVPHAQVYAI